MLVEDYLRPAAIRAGVITEKDGVTYDRDGEPVKRFGFHVLGRHSLAAFLMDEQENSAVVAGRHAPFQDGHDVVLLAFAVQGETGCA